ncbi:NAD(P)H-hydrate epimerase [Clavibacter phaseoli]|uniref:NAD(P)H-hydrate epimerase n=2 Tax=Clavibacter phaseoli TaxID=1734031 RepID=UPI001F31D79B|nr:NAD(P)H-hydrate epimerase [Clavibacter phaseoli]UKF30282.1 NAD(P)H-hydrate epimerase [Clavibacter phaseoli]UKF36200.1 NAD(P)H-hydrate epimerase [Clavibacter phaseoli]
MSAPGPGPASLADGYAAADIRAAEAPLLAAGAQLMRVAAAGLARECRTLAPVGPVLVLVGAGNNGGDALLAAAELAREGREVGVIRTASRIHEDGAARAIAAGVPITSADELDDATLADIARSSALVVDGILGIGATDDPALRGEGRRVVAALLPVVTAEGGPAVIACDIPSGVGCDDGRVPDPTVLPADVTVTFGAGKPGLMRGDGRALAGRVELVDVGLDLSGVIPRVRAS